MNRKYSGFTLIEMLIVMGIIIILMIVGITAARFAINRANDVAHRNAVDQVVTSLQAYYTDEREYPTECFAGGGNTCTPAKLVGDKDTLGDLVPYIDQGSFDGGSKATYIYEVGGDGGNQSFLVCVSLRGLMSEMMISGGEYRRDAAFYCNGPGIGDPSVLSGAVTTKEVTQDDMTAFTAIEGAMGRDTTNDWNKGWQEYTGGGGQEPPK